MFKYKIFSRLLIRKRLQTFFQRTFKAYTHFLEQNAKQRNAKGGNEWWQKRDSIWLPRLLCFVIIFGRENKIEIFSMRLEIQCLHLGFCVPRPRFCVRSCAYSASIAQYLIGPIRNNRESITVHRHFERLMRPNWTNNCGHSTIS